MNACGVPKGVYNVVHGFGPNSAGESLTTNQGVNAITFTGETRTGAAIMKAVADGGRPVSLEMGGKNWPSSSPMPISTWRSKRRCARASPTAARFASAPSVSMSNGRCSKPSFAALKKGAEGLKIGVPSDSASNMGPLVSQEHRDKVLSYYKKAVDEGATVVTGGGIPEMPGELANGAWIQPTIWTGVGDEAAIAREEIFGPCTLVMPFDGEEEVIKRANSIHATDSQPRSTRRT